MSKNNRKDESLKKSSYNIPFLIDRANLNPYEFRVYAYIKREIEEFGQCYRNSKTNAKNCNMSQSTFKKSIASLCAVNPGLGVPLITKISTTREDNGAGENIYLICDLGDGK